jgi:Domain of unknown function (DUF4386)
LRHESATVGSASSAAPPGAVRYAQIVRQWTHDLTYFTSSDTLSADERTQLLARGIGVVEGTIDQLVIDDADQLRGAIAINADLVDEGVRNAVRDLDYGFAGTAIPNPSGVSMTTSPPRPSPTPNSTPGTFGPRSSLMNSATRTALDQPVSNTRRTALIVGVLFLAGFLTYGVGNLIATGIVRSADRSGSTALFVTGIALMLLNSAFVIGIGVLMFPILRPHNKAIAVGYLGTRIFEGVVLAIGVVSLIVVTGSAAIHANSVFYNVAEAGLGIGSLFFCALLFRSGLVPRFLAVWGFLGYALFAAGSMLELFGVEGAGLVAAIPGGLFELTFGIWLIARGFRRTAPAVR